MDNLYKILIADDSESSFKIIKEILDLVGNGYELFYARDGMEACRMATDILPDMILMDVIMPEMNGIDAIKYLRSNQLTSEIPIIVLSATESLDSAYEVGANDFISKPFHKFELLIKVRSGLNLLHKIKEIKNQKAELEIKHAEVINQRDTIAMQKKDIIDDIRYSKRIQRAIFPTDDFIAGFLGQYFILNMPRNIVSGDFYWAGELEDSKIIAIADCTGHGISGAFMTMAGTAFLNEIISKNINPESNYVLFELRKMIMKLLKQKGEEGEAADGMDISLIKIYDNNRKIQFAGANNPIYIVRNSELIIYKGDRMPIGIHMHFDKPFINQEVELQSGDMIYMFTDGYADQFGGPFNKKFRYNQFQDLLKVICNLPVEKQKDELYRTISNWQGNNFQVDDILILGFKIE